MWYTKKIVKCKTNQGFTLIELMIVVAIIGLLAAMAVPNFTKYKNKAKLAQSYSMMHDISTSQKTYYLENSIYYFAQFGGDGSGEADAIFDGQAIATTYHEGTYNPQLFEGLTANFFIITIFGQFDASGTFTAGMDPTSGSTFKGGSGDACTFSNAYARMDPVEVGINATPAGAYDYFLTQSVGNFSMDGSECVFLVHFNQRENNLDATSPIVQIN
ncbi:MAG: type II secretion system protein [Bdellovibrionales bacterium]|nr:type II secretion system protein [Bdellovibrionales bacterium]